ncbi:hypothetical protein PLICRDRAFT_100931 [Plicaturopsis crispa FD-325 SS-3]|nr:hypothetical protein PLICRDRAFT_100931 [Plicaturopsis crispa FD-325 SS-3]
MAHTIQPPAHSDQLKVEFPADHVLLLTFNRPQQLNAMSPQLAGDLRAVLQWFDEEPSMWVVVVTGAGRAFCAGADLKAWNDDQQAGITTEQENVAASVHGFGAISRRHTSAKPVIAAVNGIGAYGGGVEMVLNCDLVVASADAKFALPEVKRGVVAVQGAIPRLAKIAGHQLASELLLLGKTISAAEAHTRFRFVNEVVPPSSLLPAALNLAVAITANSPDSVQSTKRALVLANQVVGHEAVVHAHVWGEESRGVYKGENIKEGLRAFGERRAPAWRNPAKL